MAGSAWEPDDACRRQRSSAPAPVCHSCPPSPDSTHTHTHGSCRDCRATVRSAAPVTAAAAFLLALATPVAAQTPTVTLSVPAATEFAEGGGNTTVTVTATLSAARTTNTVIDLTLGGTTRVTDYTVVALPDITIRAGAVTGSASLILRPVDDNFFEGDETVTIGGTASGVTVRTVEVPFKDNEEAPRLRVTGGALALSEGESGMVDITLTLLGGIFETDTIFSITLSPNIYRPAAESDFDFGSDTPPWSFNLPAGTASGSRRVNVTAVDDEESEDSESTYFNVSATVAGRSFRATSNGQLSIRSSDQPVGISVRCTSGLHVEDPLSCSLSLSGSPTTKAYSVKMEWKNSGLFTPSSHTFQVPAQSSGRNVLTRIFSVDTKAAGTSQSFDLTVSPDDDTITKDGGGINYSFKNLPNANLELDSITFVTSFQNDRSVGLHAFVINIAPSTHTPSAFSRNLEPDGAGSLIVELDSGRSVAPCHL